MIPFFKPIITQEMEEAVIHSMNNELFVLGESMYKFEEEFARYVGSKHAISVTSGTCALHLSLLALGINKNSKVVTSTNSFIASANCILMCNAKPILSDINLSDGNIDISSCDYKTADAIIPVHLYGNPCNLDEILAIKEEQKIPIIEDACQAHGAEYNGKKIGGIGDVACFSFYTTKNMTVGGDGGMITTNNDDVAKKLLLLRNHGRIGREDHQSFGYGFRLNNINAAIGRVQLKHLEKWNSRRREIANHYKNSINANFLEENKNGKSVYHQIVMLSEKRDQLIKHLEKNEIGYGIHYSKPIHKYEHMANFTSNLPKSEIFCEKNISLPSHPLLSENEIKFISETINEIV